MRYVLIFYLFLMACQPKAEAHTLPDEKIARIIADLNIADAATNGLGGAVKDSLLHIYFNQVLTMHGVTMEMYERELQLRTSDFDRMGKINQQVEQLLQTPKDTVLKSN
jgi:hypothetical protein